MSTTFAASAHTGEKYFISGVQIALRAVGLGGLEHLYDRHYAAFGYPADELKHATIGGLRDQVSWQSSLDALMRAVEIDPEQIEWQRWLALVLEELGRIDDALWVRQTITNLDRDSLENNFAIGRLLECKGQPVCGYYAQVLTGSGNYLLALARAAALSAPTVSDRLAQQRLKDRIRGELVVLPANVALHLAMGFIGIAERDEATTRTSFLTALVLAEQLEPKEGCDPWSLAFAQAFLLNHSSMTTSMLILPVDPIRFGLAKAALLLSHQAIVPALREYLATASPLFVQKLPRTYHIYNGYKIVFFKNQLYGIPQNVREFSILRGRVVDLPYADDVSGLRVMRSGLAAMLSDWQRARLKYLLRISHPHRQFTREALRVAIRAPRQALRVAIRALRLATRMVRRLVDDIYLRMHTVSGVLIDSDAAQLQQRIDAPKQEPPNVTASGHTSVRWTVKPRR